METFLLIGITIVAAIWIIRKENKKLKNTSRLHRSNKTFSEECVKLLKYEKYGCYKLTGMQYKCLKQADYGVHHGYAIAEGNNQYDFVLTKNVRTIKELASFFLTKRLRSAACSKP